MDRSFAVCWPFLCHLLAVPLPFVYRLFAARLHETNGFRTVMERSSFEATTGTVPLPFRSVSVPFLSTVDKKPSNAVPLCNVALRIVYNTNVHSRPARCGSLEGRPSRTRSTWSPPSPRTSTTRTCRASGGWSTLRAKKARARATVIPPLCTMIRFVVQSYLTN